MPTSQETAPCQAVKINELNFKDTISFAACTTYQKHQYYNSKERNRISKLER